jgi:hypothetical protein
LCYDVTNYEKTIIQWWKVLKMPALLTQRPTDLALSPVAAQIDRNLGKLRNLTSDEIAFDVALQLDYRPRNDDARERAECIRKLAVKCIRRLWGWKVELNPDYTHLRLSGGSVPIELGLSDSIHDYIVG